MTGPALFGDPIDPNEPIADPPYYPPAPYYPGPASYPGGPAYPGGPGYPTGPAYPPYPPYAPPPPYQFGYRAYDGYPQGDPRPGEAVTAAVLSLITAGLLLITGFVVIFAASTIQSTQNGFQDSHRTALFVGAGLANVIAAALLIIGGVALLSRSRAGRSTLVIGAMLCLTLGAFWLTEDTNDGGIVVWLFIFCGPVLAAGVLSCTTKVSGWLGAAAPVR